MTEKGPTGVCGMGCAHPFGSYCGSAGKHRKFYFAANGKEGSSMLKKLKPYIIGILIPLAVGGLAAFLTRNSMNIYESIEKPPQAPPGILFPIVWTVLYILMGIGSTLIYKSDADEKIKNQGLFIYGLQLAVNFFWSILFFNLQAFLPSFIWLLLLWGLIIAMIVSFWRISRSAALLQIPYLLWVTFAGYLNLMIYLLNG